MIAQPIWQQKGWVLGEIIGQGGHGQVCKVTHPEHPDKVFAMKCLIAPDEAERKHRLIQEIQNLKMLKHPATTHLVDSDVEGAAPYLITQFIEGLDLDKYLDQNVTSFSQSLDIVLSLFNTLEYCHDKGVIHRDIKPSNIRMKGPRPILIDFGLSYSISTEEDKELTFDEQLLGNGFFRLPELLVSEKGQGSHRDPRTDICFVAGIFFYMITGIIPIALEDAQRNKPHRRQSGEDKLKSLFSDDQTLLKRVVGFFDKAFEFDIGSRFQTIQEIRTALFLLTNDDIPGLSYFAEFASALGVKQVTDLPLEIKVSLANGIALHNVYTFSLLIKVQSHEDRPMRDYHLNFGVPQDIVANEYPGAIDGIGGYKHCRYPSSLNTIPMVLSPGIETILVTLPCRMLHSQMLEFRKSPQNRSVIVDVFRKDEQISSVTFSFEELKLYDFLDSI